VTCGSTCPPAREAGTPAWTGTALEAASVSAPAGPTGTFTADQEAADPTGIHPLRDTAAPTGPTRGITPSPGTASLAARAARGVTTVR
jgi:hypothetical protein